MKQNRPTRPSNGRDVVNKAFTSSQFLKFKILIRVFFLLKLTAATTSAPSLSGWAGTTTGSPSTATHPSTWTSVATASGSPTTVAPASSSPTPPATTWRWSIGTSQGSWLMSRQDGKKANYLPLNYQNLAHWTLHCIGTLKSQGSFHGKMVTKSLPIKYLHWCILHYIGTMSRLI